MWYYPENAMRLLTLIIILCVLASPGRAGNLPGLPADGFYPGWHKSDSVQVYHQNDLYGHINGGAELFLEFGFEQLQVQRYSNRPDNQLVLETYKMGSPEAALGIYLMKCGKERPAPEIEARNTFSPFQMMVRKGEWFIIIYNYSGLADNKPVLIELARSFLGQIEEKEVPLMHLLPQEQKMPGSEIIFRGPYALQSVYTFGEGDVFLQQRRVFGVLADYQTGEQGTVTRFVIPYPDEDRSRLAFAHVKKNLDPYHRVLKSSERKLVFFDYQNKFAQIEREGKYLRAVTGLSQLPPGDN